MMTCVDCGCDFEQWSAVAERQGSTRIRCRPCYRVMVRARPSYQAKHQERPAAANPRNDRRYKALRAAVLAEEADCGFCGSPVDKTLPHTDRMSASLDHIVPVSQGGAWFDRDNVRLAHRSCNSKAGNRARETDALMRAGLARAALWIGDRLAA